MSKLKPFVPSPDILARVRARYPDAHLVPMPGTTAAEFFRGGMVTSAHDATTYQIRASRFVRWTSGVEDDMDDPPGTTAMIGQGVTPKSAWADAVASIEDAERMVYGPGGKK